MINVTKTYLPPFEEYAAVLRESYESGWITNNGKLLQQLEQELKDYLGVKHLFICTNGTVTLQIALKALEVSGEVITTPFSYVATVDAVVWEQCEPVFVDIEDDTFCMDPDKIEAKISSRTRAILPTHVYGLPCNTDRIGAIGRKHGIPVIYDAAHAFGAKWKGASLLSYGEVASCSFHATKLFHMVEGGCLITNDDAIARKIYLYRQFGHVYDDYFSMGINAKNSEFHAAMGICVLRKMAGIMQARKDRVGQYEKELDLSRVRSLRFPEGLEPNYSYYPVLFKDEETMMRVRMALEAEKVFTRRYFHPALNQLPFIDYQSCPVAESVASKVLCLPLYYDLPMEDIVRICSVINKNS